MVGRSLGNHLSTSHRMHISRNINEIDHRQARYSNLKCVRIKMGYLIFLVTAKRQNTNSHFMGCKWVELENEVWKITNFGFFLQLDISNLMLKSEIEKKFSCLQWMSKSGENCNCNHITNLGYHQQRPNRSYYSHTVLWSSMDRSAGKLGSATWKQRNIIYMPASYKMHSHCCEQTVQ